MKQENLKVNTTLIRATAIAGIIALPKQLPVAFSAFGKEVAPVAASRAGASVFSVASSASEPLEEQ